MAAALVDSHYAGQHAFVDGDGDDSPTAVPQLSWPSEAGFEAARERQGALEAGGAIAPRSAEKAGSHSAAASDVTAAKASVAMGAIIAGGGVARLPICLPVDPRSIVSSPPSSPLSSGRETGAGSPGRARNADESMAAKVSADAAPGPVKRKRDTRDADDAESDGDSDDSDSDVDVDGETGDTCSVEALSSDSDEEVDADARRAVAANEASPAAGAGAQRVVLSFRAVQGAKPVVLSTGSPAAKRARRSSGSGRAVRFSEDTKCHDGLCGQNDIFDALIWDFFSRCTVRCPDNVRSYIQGRVQLYPALLNQFDELAGRIACSSHEKPVLPGGGGSAAKLSAVHLSSLLRLRELVASTAAEDLGVTTAWSTRGATESESTAEHVECPVAAAAGAGAGAGAEHSASNTYGFDIGSLDLDQEAVETLMGLGIADEDVDVDVLGTGPDSGVAPAGASMGMTTDL